MPTTVADKMLRFAGAPRQVFLSRVGLPGEYSRALAQFDAQVDRAGSIILGELPSSDPRRRGQAAAPIRHAGLA